MFPSMNIGYHKWMQSPELQELTASEPLTELEEFKMQMSWHEDEDKCTFIVIDREKIEETNDETSSMIGDTNLYLQYVDGTCEAETGIMIAVESVRRKKMGWEAMLLMLRYGIEELNVQKYVAKISVSNTKSIKMFEKLQFHVECTSEIFKEVTLARNVTDEWYKFVLESTKDYKKLQYTS